MIVASALVGLLSWTALPEAIAPYGVEKVCAIKRDFSKPVEGFDARRFSEAAWQQLQQIEPDPSKLHTPTVREQFGIITVRYVYKHSKSEVLDLSSPIAVEARILRDLFRVYSVAKINFGC